jgi:hypothetical protein
VRELDLLLARRPRALVVAAPRVEMLAVQPAATTEAEDPMNSRWNIDPTDVAQRLDPKAAPETLARVARLIFALAADLGHTDAAARVAEVGALVSRIGDALAKRAGGRG